jgi:hypothetical protein
MSLSVEFGSAPSGWDAAIEELGGTVFHSTHWGEFQHKVQGCQPVYILAKDEAGRPMGAALALYRSSRHPVLGRFLRSMEMPAYPAAVGADPAVAGIILSEAERLARKLGCARLRVLNWRYGGTISLSGLRRADRVVHGRSHDRCRYAVESHQERSAERIRRLERTASDARQHRPRRAWRPCM